jgi:signal transduction histidine kinase
MAPLSVFILTLVTIVDYTTGYETVLFLFYLPAIVLAAWYVGLFFGVLIAALSATAWVSTNIADGARYTNYFIPVWNALTMFGVYLVVLALLWRLKKFHLELEDRVRLRTESLAKEVRERVRLQRELLETSEREQRRIGRDLHDGLCQQLTGTALAGHALSQQLTGRSPADAAAVARLVDLLEGAIEMTRALSRGLNPVEIEVGRLADNFRELAETVQSRLKVACVFECPLAVPGLEVSVATHLYRIAQEAAENAARHGRATRIVISLDAAEDELILTVSDNGVGLPARRSEGLGLRLMAYRADLIGAALHIGSPAAGGTRVTCALPLLEPTSASENKT